MSNSSGPFVSVCMYDTQEKFVVNGNEFHVEHATSNGRRAYAVIDGYKISIRIPRLMKANEAAKASEELMGRIRHRLERNKAKQRYESRSLSIANFQEVEAIGYTLKLIMENTEPWKRPCAKFIGDTLHIRMPIGMAEELKKEIAMRLAVRGIIRYFTPMVNAYVKGVNARHFGFELNSVRLRMQRTRWGSCSKSKKSISLNLRLLFAPQGVIDYVIIHELAHLKAPNHSRRFWSTVSSAMPDYKPNNKWLREKGNTLWFREASTMQATG